MKNPFFGDFKRKEEECPLSIQKPCPKSMEDGTKTKYTAVMRMRQTHTPSSTLSYIVKLQRTHKWKTEAASRGRGQPFPH